MLNKLVLIGASTGGPGHIKKLLEGLSLKSAAIVIAQHMNKMFIPSFCTQLGRDNNLNTQLLSERESILGGKVYILDRNFELTGSLGVFAQPNDEAKTTYSPNVDMLFFSAIPLVRSVRTMAILLTGIGDDGARGLDKLQAQGARCVAENEESAIVYGMPKRAKELNPSIKALNLMGIKKELEEFLNE